MLIRETDPSKGDALMASRPGLESTVVSDGTGEITARELS